MDANKPVLEKHKLVMLVDSMTLVIGGKIHNMCTFVYLDSWIISVMRVWFTSIPDNISSDTRGM